MPAKCLTQSSCGHDVVMTWALPTGQDKKDVGASTAWSRIPPRPSTPLSSPPRVTILSISVKIEQTYSTYLRVNEMEQIYLQVHWLIRGGKVAAGPKQGSQLQAFGDNSIFRALTESFRNAESQADLEFVKKFTRPNFPVKEFYTLKTRKSRLFSPTINSKNT